MKSEDMLPPGIIDYEKYFCEWDFLFCFIEVKEQRKDQFNKEVEMILNAEQQKAEEMARRVRIKVTRQGLVDNDSSYLQTFTSVRELFD